jgi:hypothetical protein
LQVFFWIFKDIFVMMSFSRNLQSDLLESGNPLEESGYYIVESRSHLAESSSHLAEFSIDPEESISHESEIKWNLVVI